MPPAEVTQTREAVLVLLVTTLHVLALLVSTVYVLVLCMKALQRARAGVKGANLIRWTADVTACHGVTAHHSSLGFRV